MTRPSPATGPGWPAQRLRALAGRPRTVVDVGVSQGTPVLYEAFPDAYHVLVEPRAECEPRLREILRGVRGEYHLCAAGRREEVRELRLEPRRAGRSSFLERTALTATGDPLEARAVPVTTLDALRTAGRLRPPYLLKLDTEGFELEVLAGAGEFLRDTGLLIAEVSVARRFTGGYRFADFTAEADRLGFVLCDVLEVVRDARSDEVKYVDAAFRREG
ncbi:FkbM family methyltransferase [Kitasatospora sp. NPDC056138]|uniref:FkbM family methyltransferase n=1 Tax=Kitasatospora sp. NPDC056138 TaxID=3345724 RepID=UPI0035D9574E